MSEITQSFGQWIAKIRESKNLDLSDVSVATGIKVERLRKIENGRDMVPMREYVKLQKFFGFDLKEFTTAFKNK
jgi:transcriptional regulator with XRE-family HTH domain